MKSNIYLRPLEILSLGLLLSACVPETKRLSSPTLSSEKDVETLLSDDHQSLPDAPEVISCEAASTWGGAAEIRKGPGAAESRQRPQQNATERFVAERSPHSPLDCFDRAALPLSAKKVDEVLLNHRYFQISYNVRHLLPNWVSYHLESKNLRIKEAQRQDHFMADPLLKARDLLFLDESAFRSSHYGVHYDRGHMAPSADFTFEQAANDETFVMSNMAPQTPDLNRKAWAALESRVRRWACREGSLRVASGPVLEKGLERLRSGVSLPKRFFKVLLDETSPRKAVGFVYTQEDVEDVFQERAMTIAEVEKISGFDFFPDLDPSERDEIEGRYDLNAWSESDCRR